MKKLISLILSLVLVLSFTACGDKAGAGWQEHYDLGIKYVNEEKYEEAVLAFLKALEIDPTQQAVYIALAEVYARQGNYTAAQEILDKAIAEMAKLSAEIGQLVKRHDTELEKHDKRIEKLEHKPSMWFDRIINGIVSAVVAAFVAAALKKTGII